MYMEHSQSLNTWFYPFFQYKRIELPCGFIKCIKEGCWQKWIFFIKKIQKTTSSSCTKDSNLILNNIDRPLNFKMLRQRSYFQYVNIFDIALFFLWQNDNFSIFFKYWTMYCFICHKGYSCSTVVGV